MRVLRAIVLLLAMSWIAGLGQDARGGVTIDVVFKDTTAHTLTISPGDVGPGCALGPFGYATVSTGRCMDVILKLDRAFTGVSVSVAYDHDDGLAFAQAREWLGIGVSWNLAGKDPVLAEDCVPFSGPGVTDVGPGLLQHFDCVVGPPSNPPVAAAGTYHLGTIVWDTSGMTTPGTSELIKAVLGTGDGVLVLNGNFEILIMPTLGSRVVYVTPEPGTAALLGLGLAGVVIAARRRRG